MSFNFGTFDISSGLSTLTEGFQQVASSIESTLRDEKFGISSRTASTSGTPKAAEAASSGQSGGWLGLDDAFSQLVGGSGESTTDTSVDITETPVTSQQPEQKEQPLVADVALPSRQPPGSHVLSAAAAEAEPASDASTAAADDESRAADTAERPAAETAAAPAAAPTAQAAAKAEPATPSAAPTQQPTSATEAQLKPPDDHPQAADGASSVESMDPSALQLLVGQLRHELAVREGQLERAAAEAGQVQAALQAVTRKNEELVKSKAKVSEHDVEEMQREFEARLAAAERKAFALTKERDTLKRAGGRSSGAEELLHEKDEIIKAVMAEGEALSKKQLAQETAIKQLRAQAKALREEGEEVKGRLEAEQGKAAAAAAQRSATAAEMAGLREQHASELASERQHYDWLLAEARAAQATAEQRAADAARQGTARKLRDAEARAEGLEGTVAELRAELERQRAGADEREDLLSGEVSELQRRCAEAEARQQEMQGKLPEATQPLLRQLEAMQQAADAQAAAAAKAERDLLHSVAAAESALAESRAAQEATSAALLEAQAQVAALREQLQQARAAAAAAESAAGEERRQRQAAEAVAGHLRSDVASSQESLATLERVYAQQIEAVAAREEAAVRAAAALQRQLDAQQQSQQPGSPPRQPPSLAAPGFKWTLVREGEQAATAPAPSSPGPTAGAGGAQRSAGRPGEQQQQQQPGRREELDGEDLRVGGAMLWSAAGVASAPLAGADAAAPAATSAQVAALQRLVSELESTRERLSTELVKVSTEAAHGQAAQRLAESLGGELEEVRARLHASMVLLGEREERLEEVQADVADMRASYRRQVEQLALELAELQGQ